MYGWLVIQGIGIPITNIQLKDGAVLITASKLLEGNERLKKGRYHYTVFGEDGKGISQSGTHSFPVNARAGDSVTINMNWTIHAVY